MSFWLKARHRWCSNYINCFPSSVSSSSLSYFLELQAPWAMAGRQAACNLQHSKPSFVPLDLRAASSVVFLLVAGLPRRRRRLGRNSIAVQAKPT